MTGYVACCCYGAPVPCAEPFTLEHGGIFEWSFNTFPGLLATNRKKFEVRWSITFDLSLPVDAIRWDVSIINEDIWEPGAADPRDYFIKTTLNLSGTRLNDDCFFSSDVGCPQYQPTSDKGLRSLRPVLPFNLPLDGYDLPDPNQVVAGTSTGTFEIGGVIDANGTPATLETLVAPPFSDLTEHHVISKWGGVGGTWGYYILVSKIWNHFPTTSPHAGAQFYIPFDGTNGDPNPMGTQPFVSCGFPTTSPSLSIETRPIIAYTEDGGQQGGVPTSVHPFQGFPDVPVVLQQFPQVLGSWFCDGDNFPLVNGYQVIQYSGDIGP